MDQKEVLLFCVSDHEVIYSVRTEDEHYRLFVVTPSNFILSVGNCLDNNYDYNYLLGTEIDQELLSLALDGGKCPVGGIKKSFRWAEENMYEFSTPLGVAKRRLFKGGPMFVENPLEIPLSEQYLKVFGKENPWVGYNGVYLPERHRLTYLKDWSSPNELVEFYKNNHPDYETLSLLWEKIDRSDWMTRGGLRNIYVDKDRKYVFKSPRYSLDSQHFQEMIGWCDYKHNSVFLCPIDCVLLDTAGLPIIVMPYLTNPSTINFERADQVEQYINGIFPSYGLVTSRGISMSNNCVLGEWGEDNWRSKDDVNLVVDYGVYDSVIAESFTITEKTVNNRVATSLWKNLKSKSSGMSLF